MTADDQSATQRSRRKAIPGISESEERLLAMVTALTGQLAVARERIDTLERLLSRSGVLSPDAIETFEADATESAERDALRRSVIAKVFRPLQDAAERDLQLARKANAADDDPDPGS